MFDVLSYFFLADFVLVHNYENRTHLEIKHGCPISATKLNVTLKVFSYSEIYLR